MDCKENSGFCQSFDFWSLSFCIDLLHSSEVNVYRLQGQFATGNFDYESNGTGSLNNKKDRTFDLRALLGRDYLMHGFGVTPYAGFGYRFLLDKSKGRQTTTGAFGY